MAVNSVLMLKVLETVEQVADVKEGEFWSQASWRTKIEDDDRCGTGMCFAGWAVQIAGGKWVSDPDDRDFRNYLYADEGEEGSYLSYFGPAKGNRIISAERKARLLLGLTEYQADKLFAGSNTLDQLRSRVKELVSA